ncbi:DUF2510 domain-containing protein [Actinomadura scrupuli]|uniref:DUF2510 domain-containing protein n=1 Tax=Actinomadura scrupuli TaxID=559629 RepID=UPI003D96861A
MSAPSPPGWFPDPYGGAGLLRFWDGTDWTQSTQPVADEPAFLPPLAGPSDGGTSPYGTPGHEPYPFQAPERPYDTVPGPPGPPYAGQTGLPARAGSGNGPLWALAGGAALVVVVLVAVGVVVGLRSSGGRGPGPGPEPVPPAATGPVSPRPTSPGAAPGGTTSGSIGRITDEQAGLSYARLGSPWADAGSSWFRPGYFSAGQVSIVQEPFEEYASFNATSLSGVPRAAESAGHSGSGDLEAVTGRVTRRILTEHFALARTRTELGSRAFSVSGRPAWIERFRLDFTDARTRGWKFTADTVAIMVVDLGDRRLGLLWVSVPDTFPGQGDLDLVLSSVRVS